jgi:hypothetical protein
MAVNGTQFDFGFAGARKDLMRPVNTLDWTGFVTSAPMSNNEIFVTGTVTRPAAGIGALAGFNAAGSSISGSAMKPGSLNNNAATGAQPLAVNRPAHKMTWTREQVTREDFNLVKNFAAKVDAFGATYAKMEKTIAAAKLEDDESPQLYTTNLNGGWAFIPLNRLGSVYRSTVVMNLLRSLKTGSYEAFPKTGTRNLRFRYGLPGTPASTINKTLSF